MLGARRSAPKPSLVKETIKPHIVRSFFDYDFDPSKTQNFCNRKFKKKNDNFRSFCLSKRVNPRTGQLETVFFCSWSLFAPPGHRIPSAVWLLGAQAFANKISSLSLGRPILRKHCHTQCLQANLFKKRRFSITEGPTLL